MIGLGIGLMSLQRSRAAPPATFPNAGAFIAAREDADDEALEAGVKQAYEDFIAGCIADDIWDKMEQVLVHVGARTLAGVAVPMKGTAPTLVSFSSDDLNRVTGLKGDGTSTHILLNRKIYGGAAKQRHVAHYVSDWATAAGRLYGCLQSSYFISPTLHRFGRSPNDNVDREGGPSTLAAGFVAQEHTSNALCNIWDGANFREGLRAGLDSEVNDMMLFAQNNDGTPSNFSTARLAFFCVGDPGVAALLKPRVETLMSDIAGALA